MQSLLLLTMGLEYVDAVFQTLKGTDLAQYSIAGMKTLAVLFFLINILKKYNEGAVSRDGHTWGLSPSDLIKNFTVVLLVIFSTQILGFFDGILTAIESQYRDTAPALIPIQMVDLPIEEDVDLLDAARLSMTLLYEALVTPFYPLKVFAFIISVFLWLIDLFIYPLFLCERFFLLGLMQAFFPLVISLATFEKFRSMAYSFFKLYAGVYMLVPAFFFVNIFVNAIYSGINTKFWFNLFGTDYGSTLFAPIVQLGTMFFIVILKFKLYKKAISFTLRLFSS